MTRDNLSAAPLPPPCGGTTQVEIPGRKKAEGSKEEEEEEEATFSIPIDPLSPSLSSPPPPPPRSLLVKP